MHKARITPAISPHYTIYAYMRMYAQSNQGTLLHHLRITLHYADFFAIVLPHCAWPVVVAVLPYLLLLRGLRLEKIFLFNLFMNEMAALRWACLSLGLAIKAIEAGYPLLLLYAPA